jgi:L-2,4-diaminobutyric acid acetyltransferase
VLRRPVAEDGPAITALIAACPPLDPNSAYCNLLQCSHFAGTSIVAERDGEIVGWISGYRVPTDPSRLFVWQVAVSEAARGQALAGRMLDGLVERPEADGVTHVITTVTRANDASWAMFRKWASRRGAPLGERELFLQDRHFAGRHATEWQVEIGPLAR